MIGDIMSEKKWKNKWIGNPKFEELQPLQMLHKQFDTEFKIEKHEEGFKNNHTLFRKEVMLSSVFKNIVLDISADDYYKLYINGKFVTLGPANSYPFSYHYNKIDVSTYFHEGINIVGVHVYYQGLINRAYNSGDYRQGMIAELFADGELIIDDCWKYAEAKEYSYSRVIAYDTQFDEIIDNRFKLVGWKEIAFDDSQWKKAAIKEKTDYQLVLQQTKNLQMEYIKPKEVKKLANGYLLDFGRELTGTFYMKAVGRAGEEVDILFGEELESEIKVRYDMRCNCVYQDKLILAEGENELEQYEYKCFRYVQLRTKSNIKMEEFQVDYRHYPFDEDYCQFHSKEELVNRIFEICKNAVENCAQEAFLDCPHREKGQYLGDLTVTAHAHLYLTGDSSLLKKALQDFTNSTKICEGMMAVAPGSFMQEIADFSLLFPYQVLLYYEFTKDKKFLQEMLLVSEGIKRFFSNFENETGLIENVKLKWNLVDWPATLRDDYDFDLTDVIVGDGCHNVINALYLGMIKCIEEMKAILLIPYHSKFEHLKQVYIKTFYNEEVGLFVDSSISKHSSLHSNAFAVFYGLEPKNHSIVEFVREKGLCCGVYVSYFVLEGLMKLGEGELVYDLITNKTEHSWYNMLKEGATTSYEAWGKEQKGNTSLCHGWAAAPIPILMKYFT